MSYFVDQRTKYRFNAYSSELQAARFCGKRHTAEHNRNMSEALKEAWKRVTPEEQARRIAARLARGYQKCRPGCTCAKHDPEVCAKRREKLRGKQRVARGAVASGRGAAAAHQGADVPSDVALLDSHQRSRAT